eukprot:1340174-Pleurochrysis_carterae.AAC.2
MPPLASRRCASSTSHVAARAGFAGDGCEQVDARIFVVIGALALLALLALVMLATWGVRALMGACAHKSAYTEPLMAS